MTPTLIERIESAAGADQRELLIEACEKLVAEREAEKANIEQEKP